MYLLIDGENIDATLGINILKHPPLPEERPRWDRVLRYDPWKSATAHGTGDTPTPADGVKSRHSVAPLAANKQGCAVTSKPIKSPIPCTTNGLFFINASERVATNFVQALLAIGWQPILLTSSDPDVKVVDAGIQSMLSAIERERPGADIVIASHDVDYRPYLQRLLEAGHRVGIICFREYLSSQLAELESLGLKIIDLEYDIGAFNQILNRVHPIAVEEFDPMAYL